MRTWKRWLVLGMLSLAIGLSGCGFAGEGQEETENEQALPGQADEEGGEGGEGGEGADD
jgi:hypothetical protein